MECIHTYIHTYGTWVASTIVLAFITLLLLGGGRHIYRKKKEDNSVRTQKNDAKVSGDGHVVIQSGDNPSITIAMPENGSPVRQSDDPTPIATETRRKITKKNGDQVDETIVKFFDTPAGKELANKHFSEKYQGTTLMTCQKCCVKFYLLAPTLEIAEKIREDGKSGRLESVIVELLKLSPIPDLDCEKLRIKVTNVNVTTRSAKGANMTSDVRVDQEQQLVYQPKNPIPTFSLLRLKDLPKTWATLAKMAMGFGAILHNFVALVSSTSTGHKVSNGDREECSPAEEIIVEVTFEVEKNEMKHQEPEQLSLTKYTSPAVRTKHSKAEIYTPKDFVNANQTEEMYSTPGVCF
ncbi:PREDICTED: uncharacterized protein LOC109464538 [Branchiostoma belcheri]|uniref:Uncharacterized protein LOC109464538 n=1 Tax=Branchiostoma belcheri TaxID=7741 RepID=A0A6P4YEC4_BRABE|nr:PREDICTED: uncharacterized protein LOC109464538 [Branchiostoma belcheri]